MAQRRAVVAADYDDPLRIGTPGYAEELARDQAFTEAVEHPFNNRPWMRQELSGEYDRSSTDGAACPPR